MPIPSNEIITTAIKARLAGEGFDLDEAPQADVFIDVVVDEIISAVKAATVSTIVSGTLTPPTAVAGTGVGDPGTGTGLS